MSEPSQSVLVSALKGLIRQTFDISAEDARKLASGLAASGKWGNDDNPAPIFDWSYRVKEELGEKLPWKSEAEQERFRLEQALSKHLKPPTLGDFVERNEAADFRNAAIQIARKRHAKAEEIETLKAVVSPAWQPTVPMEPWRLRRLKNEGLIALIAAGAGADPFVLNRLESLTMEYLTERSRFDGSPIGLLALVAMNDRAAVAVLRKVSNKVSWSVRLACLYAFPESRKNGNYQLIRDFKMWLEQTGEPAESYRIHNWKAWKLFMSCLTIDGSVQLCGQERVELRAPFAEGSPLIDWASERGMDSWLMGEAMWLRQRGFFGEEAPLRNRLVERAVPGAVDFCMELIKDASHEDNAHWAIESLLRKHPKPLSKAALDACMLITRLQCHRHHYKQRIEALRLLREGVDSGNYPKGKVAGLIFELAEGEPDPDVRVAAIDLVRWAGAENLRKILEGALANESSRIREAALRVMDG
jgi:hypothetical protein